MSYEVLEASTQDGTPVYKFEFAQGGTFYRYTTADMFISDSVGTWEPVALVHGDFEQTSELAKNGIPITMPRTLAVAQLFLNGIPEGQTSLTIYRGHDQTDHASFQVIWKGRVVRPNSTGDEVTLMGEDVLTSFKQSGLRNRYQKGCPHALYSVDCGLTRSEWATTVTVTSVTGFDLNVSGFNDGTVDSTPLLADNGYYSNGLVELPDGTLRHVLSHLGGALTLLRPFSDLVLPLNITAYPGCSNTLAACNERFGNAINYGGFPWIPSKNPFGNNVNGSIV
ncbi:MAG: phage BR0599 family protein [Pseudomonadota bacterium]